MWIAWARGQRDLNAEIGCGVGNRSSRSPNHRALADWSTTLACPYVVMRSALVSVGVMLVHARSARNSQATTKVNRQCHPNGPSVTRSWWTSLGIQAIIPQVAEPPGNEMKLTFLGTTSSGGNCPNLYATDHDTYVVQGYKITPIPRRSPHCTSEACLTPRLQSKYQKRCWHTRRPPRRSKNHRVRVT